MTDKPDPLVGTDCGLPPLHEVLLSDQDHLQQTSSQDTHSYNPTDKIDDLFAGLTEENLYADGSGEATPEKAIHPDSVIAQSPQGVLENRQITLEEEAAIRQGMEDLSNLGRMLEDFADFAAPLPITQEASIGAIFGLSEILDSRLKCPVYNYFNDALDPPTTDGLVEALQKISGTVGDLDIKIGAATGGYDAEVQEISFALEYGVTRTGEVFFDIGAMADEVGLAFGEAELPFTACLRFDFTFGVDCCNQFFIAVDQLEATVGINEDNLDVGVTLIDETPQSLKVENGTVDLDARLSVQFDEAIVGDGRITHEELQGITAETINDLVYLVSTGTLVAELPLDGHSTIYITDADLFDGVLPHLSVGGDISPLEGTILNLFKELSEVGAGISDSGPFNLKLPVIDASINRLLFEDQDLGFVKTFDLYTPALEYFTLVEVFNFDINDYASEIGALPGIDISDFNINIDLHRLTLKNLIENEFDCILDPDWDISLYLPEIWSLLNPDFQVNDYLPKFQVLLGLPYIPRMAEVRSDLKSYFGSVPSMKGLVDYIRTTRVKDSLGIIGVVKKSNTTLVSEKAPNGTADMYLDDDTRISSEVSASTSNVSFASTHLNEDSANLANPVEQVSDALAEQRTESLISANGPPAEDAATLDWTIQSDDTVIVNPSDTLSGSGQINGSVINHGVVSPGNSPGIQYVDTFTQAPDGTLDIEIGGLNPGPGDSNIDDGYDQINVTGLATLDGTLSITLINDFTPSLGDTFEILTYGSVDGDFATFLGTEIGDGLVFSPRLEAGSYFLDVETAINYPETVLEGLRALPEVLGKAFRTELPFIGTNLADILGISEYLQQTVDTLRAFETVEDLQSLLEAALGTAVGVEVTSDDIQFILTFNHTFNESIEFGIDETLAGVDFEVDGSFQAEGSADVGLRLGVSLNPELAETDRFYLIPGPDSYVDITFRMDTVNPITAMATLDFGQVGVHDGTAMVAGRSGMVIYPSRDATATLSFNDPGEDGRITLTEILNNPLEVLDTPSFDAAVRVVLPISPPLDSMGLDDVTVQFDWTDLGDPDSLSITYDEAALRAFLIDPGAFLQTVIIPEAARIGLGQLEEWFTGLVSCLTETEAFTTPLPLVNRSLSDLINPEEIFPLISNALLDFLNNPSATSQSYVDQVGTSLELIEGQVSGLSMNVDAGRIFAGLLSALDSDTASLLGYETEGDLVLFNIGFDTIKTISDPENPLVLSDTENTIGVNLEIPADIQVTLDVDLTFGYDLTEGLAPSDAVFVRLNKLEGGISVVVDNTADIDLSIGFLSVTVENGSLNLDAGLGMELMNPDRDPDGRITLSEVLGTSPAGLIDIDILTTSLYGNLPMTAAIGDLALASATLVIEGDPLSGELPDVRIEGADRSEFLNFSHFTPSMFLSALEQVAVWLNAFTGSDVLNEDIPLVDLTVGEALDLAQAYSDKFTSLLYDDSGYPNYTDSDDFVIRVGELTDIDVTGSDYNESTDLFSYTFYLSHDFVDILKDLSFDMDLSPFGNFESASQLSVGAHGDLALTLGVDLSPFVAMMRGERALPSQGRLSQDAHFDLMVNDSPVFSLTVSSAATQDNTYLSHLAADVNAALQTALMEEGLDPGFVVAGVSGDRLTLTTAESFMGASILFGAVVDDAAVTELGLGILGESYAAVITAQDALPEDGILSADATFELSADGADPVSVTVPAVYTSNNVGREDLVADIDAALFEAELFDVVAGLDPDGHLTLTLRGLNAQLHVTATGTAMTELSLGMSQDQDPDYVSQITDDGLLDHLYLEDVVAGGTVDILGSFDASAIFGPAKISINNASAGLHASADFVIDSTVPVSVVDLFDNLDTYFTAQDLSLAGTADLNLPVTIEGDLADIIQISELAHATVHSDDIFDPSSWQAGADFSGLGVLLNFGNLDFDTILQVLQHVYDYLVSVSSSSALAKELPLINMSVGEVLDFVREFGRIIDELENNPAATLQLLDQKLEEALANALGQPVDDLVTLQLLDGGQDFRISLNFTCQEADTLPLNLDFEALGLGEIAELPGVGNLLDIQSQGEVTVETSASLDLVFGLHLTDPQQPRPYIYETTGLELGAKIYGEDVNYSVVLGPLGGYIRSGSVTLGEGSIPLDLRPATFSVGLQPKPETGGRYYLVPNLSDMDIGITGEVHADLPVYCPTDNPSDLLGSFALDIPDLGNLLNALFSGLNPSPFITFRSPDLSNLFSDTDFLCNLDGLMDGLDFIFEAIQDALDGEIFGFNFPLVGDNLKGAVNFISDIRDHMMSALQTIPTPAVAEAIEQALFDLFYTQLGWLMDGDDPGTDITIDDVSVFIDPDPVPEGEYPDEVEFQFRLGSIYTFSEDIGFDFGLPGLGFEVTDESSVQVDLGWVFEIGIGMSRTDGFYFTTYDPAVPDNHTIEAWLDITLPDLQALGRIGFLQLLIEDDATDSTLLSGDLFIDILDPDGRLTFEEMASGRLFSEMVEADLVMDVLANLDFTLGFAFDQVGSAYVANTDFPTLTADFILDWTFEADSGLGSLTAPDVSFENIHLNLSSFLTGFVGDILDPIRAALGPVEPVIDILTTPLPVISDLAGRSFTLLDLARYFGHSNVADFIEGIEGVIDLVNYLEGIGDDLFIDLGSLHFGANFDLRDSASSISGLNPDALPAGVIIDAPSQDVQTQLQSKASEFYQAKNNVTGGFILTILEEPKTAIGLLFGRDVSLFEYEMPTLRLGFSYRQKFGPIWPFPPVFVHIGGNVQAVANFTFGYDTHGLSAFINNPNDASVLSDGFYLSDRIQGDRDMSEVALWGELVAGASIDIWIAEVGVEGGVFAEVDLNLHDPNLDGKIRISEIQDNLMHGGAL